MKTWQIAVPDQPLSCFGERYKETKPTAFYKKISFWSDVRTRFIHSTILSISKIVTHKSSFFFFFFFFFSFRILPELFLQNIFFWYVIIEKPENFLEKRRKGRRRRWSWEANSCRNSKSGNNHRNSLGFSRGVRDTKSTKNLWSSLPFSIIIGKKKKVNHFSLIPLNLFIFSCFLKSSFF